MGTDVVTTIAGIAILVAGGEAMVRGASALAGRLGVSPLMIGLTVVAFGTSAPELTVNAIAAYRGNVGLSFGNIFGSNMANIGLIIAMAALMKPLSIKNVIIAREVPMMILATGVAMVMGLDRWLDASPGVYTRGDGIALLLLFSVFVYYTIGDAIDQRASARRAKTPLVAPAYSTLRAASLTGGGIAALVAGGAITVSGALGVARALGVAEDLVGLTLIAVGTSLPELVASVMATARGHGDLAVGNVVGSNIFNLLVVLGTTATIRPVPVPEGGIGDLFAVLGLSTLLWITSVSQKGRIIRAEAALLLALYAGFMIARIQ